ncbi:MAG: hypothetical protein B6226_00740 [Candidatus Cloacimonetes bacterium 4572_65]|nr:MAG: hypothetical protein B6226_00740 [Candidatus Cloacimonetes bacterium 4572_65]
MSLGKRSKINFDTIEEVVSSVVKTLDKDGLVYPEVNNYGRQINFTCVVKDEEALVISLSKAG